MSAAPPTPSGGHRPEVEGHGMEEEAYGAVAGTDADLLRFVLFKFSSLYNSISPCLYGRGKNNWYHNKLNPVKVLPH